MHVGIYNTWQNCNAVVLVPQVGVNDVLARTQNEADEMASDQVPQEYRQIYTWNKPPTWIPRQMRPHVLYRFPNTWPAVKTTIDNNTVGPSSGRHSYTASAAQLPHARAPIGLLGFTDSNGNSTHEVPKADNQSSQVLAPPARGWRPVSCGHIALPSQSRDLLPTSVPTPNPFAGLLSNYTLSVD